MYLQVLIIVLLCLPLTGSAQAVLPPSTTTDSRAQPDDLPRGARYQYYRFEAHRHTALNVPDIALLFYQQAFSSGPACLSDLLQAASLALQVDSQRLARIFFRRAFLEGLSAPVFAGLLERKGAVAADWVEWLDADSIRAWQRQYRSGLDTALLARLQVLEREDQRFRADDTEDDLAARRADSLNAAALRDIVTTLGRLPGNSDVGYQGLDVLVLLFLHMDHENLGWFLPHILAQVRAGEYFDVDGLAYQIDRIAVSSGFALYVDEHDHLVYDTIMPVFAARQYYSVTGYWYEALPPDGQQYVWPVYEPFRTTRMPLTRRRLHLDSYEAFLQRRSWILPISAATLKEKLGG